MPVYPSIPFFELRATFRQSGPQNATLRTNSYEVVPFATGWAVSAQLEILP